MTTSMESLVAKPVSMMLETSTSQSLPPQVVEQYRLLARKLEAGRRAGGPKAFVVTSPQARDGRTSIAIACAQALSGRGLRVALVDLDLRNPMLAERQGLMPLPGLTDYVAGRCSIDDLLQVVPGMPSMVFVAAGDAQSDPSSLFFEPRTRHLLDNLRGTFDFVVCDGPAALPYADAPCLADLVGGALLVARAGRTSRRDLAAAAAQLGGAPILGCVLAGADRFACSPTTAVVPEVAAVPRRPTAIAPLEVAVAP